MQDTIDTTPARPFQDLRSNPQFRQGLMLVLIAASVAIGFAVVLWSQSPNYGLLYNKLTDTAMADVVQALDAAGIQHKIDASGSSISVPAKHIHEARMKLAAQGLPESAGIGLEMMEEDPGFGVSQFMEKNRYHHALETELGRTITRIKAVETARVHLALAPPSVFVRDRRESKASVVLDVHPGLPMEPAQVAAIVHLVASSVPELSPDAVTVVDQNGRLLSSPRDNDEYALSAKQFEQRRRMEQDYASRIEELLSPVVGFGRVRAKVVAELDFTQIEQTQESYDPDRLAVRSESSSVEESTGNRDPAGIPGALSNQPPVAGADAPGVQEGERPVNRSREDVRNFEVGRTISHTRRPTGSVQRLSVAVLVDSLRTVDADGNETVTPLDAAMLDRLTSLAREAVGFDEARGDTIEVVNASFEGTGAPAAGEPLKFWEQPLFRDLVRQGLGALVVLVIIFGVLRPAMRGLVTPPPQLTPQLATAGAGVAALPGGAEAQTPTGAQPVGELPAPAGPSFDEAVTAARTIAGNDPKRVAQVVKQWVAENE